MQAIRIHEVDAASLLQGMTAHYLTHGVRETRPGDVAKAHRDLEGRGTIGKPSIVADAS